MNHFRRSRKRGEPAVGTEAPVPLGVVSALASDPRREGRVAVKVGQETVAVVNAEVLVNLGISIGTVLTPDLGSRLADEAQALRTYDKALELLAVMARSSHTLKIKLRQRGFSDAHIGRAIERLTTLGYLDDAAYARQVAESKLRSRGLSPMGLKNELYKRGIRGEAASEAVEEVLAENDVDTLSIVREVAAKKLRTMRGIDRRKQRQRLYGFLARRQYSNDDIFQVINELLDEDSNDSEY